MSESTTTTHGAGKRAKREATGEHVGAEGATNGHAHAPEAAATAPVYAPFPPVEVNIKGTIVRVLPTFQNGMVATAQNRLAEHANMHRVNQWRANMVSAVETRAKNGLPPFSEAEFQAAWAAYKWTGSLYGESNATGGEALRREIAWKVLNRVAAEHNALVQAAQGDANALATAGVLPKLYGKPLVLRPRPPVVRKPKAMSEEAWATDDRKLAYDAGVAAYEAYVNAWIDKALVNETLAPRIEAELAAELASRRGATTPAAVPADTVTSADDI